MFQTLLLPVLLLIFGGAATVRVPGIQPSDTTDVLSTRLGLGEAYVG